MSDPYKILGVSKGTASADIKSAYRKLAKKNHPDQNPDDPKAKERFSRINNAYAVVGDDDKRGQFDRGEIDGDGNALHPGYQQGHPGMHPGARTYQSGPAGGAQQGFGGGNAEDILSGIFGGLGGGRGGFGGRQTQGGFGAQPGARQSSMKGEDVTGKAAVTVEQITAGEKISVTLNDGRTLSVSLPKGVEDGQLIRLKGQGQQNPLSGAVGDAKIKIRFVPHPHFKVDGNNLRYDAPLHLYEAYLGCKIQVPTLTGRINLTVPPKSNSGKTLRVPGKGLPGKKKTGDLLVTLQIHFPDQPDAEFETLMAKWAAEGKPPLKDK